MQLEVVDSEGEAQLEKESALALVLIVRVESSDLYPLLSVSRVLYSLLVVGAVGLPDLTNYTASWKDFYSRQYCSRVGVVGLPDLINYTAAVGGEIQLEALAFDNSLEAFNCNFLEALCDSTNSL